MSIICRAVPLGAALLIAACVEKPVAPVPLGDVHLIVVSGDSQSGPAGQELPQPLVVRVTGSNGKGVRGQLVNFRVTAGGGRMFAGSSLTDMNGVAQDYWTLGSPGEQLVEVVAVEPTSGAKQHFGSFRATAVAPAALSISPSNANFGTIAIGSSSASQTFTVTNTGDEVSGTVVLTVGGAHASNFAITSNTCTGVALPGGATCTASVSFSPTASGSRVATLVALASPGGSVSVALSGTGALAASLAISPASYAFGTVTVGGSSASQTFTLTNTGGAPASTVGVAITGANSLDFVIVGTNCAGVTLNPGQSCGGSLIFSPTAGGTRAADLTATTSGITGSAPLSGSGFVPAALSTDQSFNFGNAYIGSTTPYRTFTVTNTGGSSSGPMTVSITGANAADFNLGSHSCSSLAPQQSCTVQARFAPLAAGTRVASLEVVSGSGASVTSALSGTGMLVTAQLSIAPASHDFGSVVMGGSPASQMFTIANIGPIASGPIQVSFTGTFTSQLGISNDNCSAATLGPSASCTLVVTFDPVTQTPMTATLTASASPGGTASSSITGSGIYPVSLSVNPTSLTFASQAVRTFSAPQRITITNIATTTASSLQFGMAGAVADFVLTNTCNSSLAPGASCTIDVVFSPTVTGTRSATLWISGPAYLRSISLTGTGM